VGEEIVVLGIPLAAVTAGEAVERALRGGLVLAPAAPALCDIPRDASYREALLGSDVNLTDSGFVLLVRLLRGHGLPPRTSGLRYLHELLLHPSVREPGATYWVMPSPEALARNAAWLNERGLPVREEECYVAPVYPRGGGIEDPELLRILQERRPRHVFICVGGGVQEKLGLYLKRSLTYRPSIHCLGAAIGFLSGEQARIPLWADRLALGWLVRCLTNPRVFVPRYLRALKVAYLVLRYDEKPPPTIAPAP
jgi:UDP-N-acetyl-D-mannosaminuronic acid transferase (WecB/TagA/CpsF family)